MNRYVTGALSQINPSLLIKMKDIFDVSERAQLYKVIQCKKLKFNIKETTNQHNINKLLLAVCSRLKT